MACRPLARPGVSSLDRPTRSRTIGRIVEDLPCRAPVVEAQQQRDQPLDQHGVAVGAQVQPCRRPRARPPARPGSGSRAPCCRSALQRLGQWRQVPAELDQVLDLVAPVLEEAELLLERVGGIGDGGVVRHRPDMRRGRPRINLSDDPAGHERRAIRSVGSRRICLCTSPSRTACASTRKAPVIPARTVSSTDPSSAAEANIGPRQ